MINITSGMHSVSIELLRTGTPYNQTISPGITYLALCGSHPPAEFRVDLEQYKFNQYLKLLRYTAKGGDSRALAIEALQKIITDIFEKITALLVEASDAKEWLHIRLIMTPKELAMLPFELALTPKGFQGMQEKPFLLNQQRLTTLTREIRQAASKRYEWPYKIRILYAWAEPSNVVPHVEHFNQLVAALKPYALPFKEIPEPVPDVSTLLTEIKNADLSSIQKALETAVLENRPYTHVHLLAHGIEKEDENGKHFALALQTLSDKEETPVDGLQLASALIVVHNGKTYAPAVVTITACDSGNANDPVYPGGSLAHALHASGVPCVFASQFPLSFPGSTSFVECIYPRLIRGDDPRIALYYTREALKNVDLHVHDWASLVAYARFPDDIDAQLKAVQLKMRLEALRINNGWADHLLFNINTIAKPRKAELLEKVKRSINTSIEELVTFLTQVNASAENPSWQAEQYGVLGSGCKRKSEYLFRFAAHADEESDALLKESTKTLKQALAWYKKGFDVLPASHWTGSQYLSLLVIIKGSLLHHADFWFVVKFMAEQDLKNSATRIWALGTLAELYMLQPLTVSKENFDSVKASALTQAIEYVKELVIAGESFPIESTARQFDRYINWWPEMFKTTAVTKLKEMATEVRTHLPDLE